LLQQEQLETQEVVGHDETPRVQSCIDSDEEEEEQEGLLLPVVELQLGASFVEEDMKQSGDEDEGKA